MSRKEGVIGRAMSEGWYDRGVERDAGLPNGVRKAGSEGVDVVERDGGLCQACGRWWEGKGR